MEGQTDRLPAFYSDRIRQDLGPFYDHLPAGALMHDPNAYLKGTSEQVAVTPVVAGRRRPRPAVDEVVESATTSL